MTLRVEFIGLPGVGKSTLRRDLLRQLHRIDKNRYLSSEEAFLQVSKMHIDTIYRRPLNYLPNSLALKLSGKLMNRSLMQFEAQNTFLADKGGALEAFFASNAYRNMSLKDRKVVISSFLETGSLWQCIDGKLPEKVAILFEEGFVQKSFMFVDYSNDSLIEGDKLCRYIENIPLPDLVIYVRADIKTCQSRMMARPEGLTERLKSADAQKITNFLTTANNHLKFVTTWFGDNCGEKLIEVNNEQEFGEVVSKIIGSIQKLTAYT